MATGLISSEGMSRRFANQLGQDYTNLSYLSAMMATVLLIKTLYNALYNDLCNGRSQRNF